MYYSKIVLFIAIVVSSNAFANNCFDSLSSLVVSDTRDIATNKSDQFLLNVSKLRDLELIVKINNYFAFLIEDLGMIVEVDAKFIKLFEKARLLEMELSKIDEWKKGITERKDLQVIEIKHQSLTDDKEDSSLNIRQGIIRLMEEGLVLLPQGLRDTERDLLGPILDKLKELALKKKSYLKYNTGNIIGGLVKELDIKKIVSDGYDKTKLPTGIDELIAYLKNYLPINLTSRFDPKRVNLETTERDKILFLLKDILETEDHFKKLFLLHYFFLNKNYANNAIIKYFINQFKNNQTLLKYFTDQTIFKKVFKSITDDEDLMNHFMNKTIDPLIAKVQKQEKTRLKSIFLREVAPAVSINRGCVGFDCSTSFNWLYPYNYTERVFFIYDDMTKKRPIVKGYLAGIDLLIDGVKTFWVHTISGGNIGSLRASIILEALVKDPSIVASSRIAISTPSAGYLTHPEIHKAYGDAILRYDGKKIEAERVSFYDATSRSFLELLSIDPKLINTGVLHYDKMKNIQENIILLENKEKDSSIIKSNITDIKESSPFHNTLLSKSMIVRISLILDSSGRMLYRIYKDNIGEIFLELEAFFREHDFYVDKNWPTKVLSNFRELGYQGAFPISLIMLTHLHIRPNDAVEATKKDGWEEKLNKLLLRNISNYKKISEIMQVFTLLGYRDIFYPHLKLLYLNYKLTKEEGIEIVKNKAWINETLAILQSFQKDITVEPGRYSMVIEQLENLKIRGFFTHSY